MHIKSLKIEYLESPLGLDEQKPRFYWQCGFKQFEYQIIVTIKNGQTAWNSGRVKSSQSVHIEYAGEPLQPTSRYDLSLEVWDENGNSHQASSFWETGKLANENWHGEWITADRGELIHVPYFRKQFRLKKILKSARLYTTARGIYSIRVNGSNCNNNIFSPGYTDYTKRIHYQSYDITELLKSGENELIAAVGDGWFCGNISGFGRCKYGKDVMFLANLHLEYIDNSVEYINTDSSWETATGPILKSDMQMGESHDARQKNGEWRKIRSVPLDKIKLIGEYTPSVKKIMELKPVSVKQLGDKWIFDMGQNMVGWAKLRIRGKRGEQAILRFAEMLNPDGSIYTQNLRGAQATDCYILAGNEIEEWEPEFTFHGFRYVELSGVAGLMSSDTITGIVIYSKLPETSKFKCSNTMVNQLFQNILWGQRGNFVDIPTDCPQRDERLGWTGDALVFIRTACYNMESITLMRKWLTSLRDAQHINGNLPVVAPVIPETREWESSSGWGDAAVFVPHALYEFYGDIRIIEENFSMMKLWVNWCLEHSNEYIRPKDGFGDWLVPGQETCKSLISTAFFARSAFLSAKAATILGLQEEEDYHLQLFEHIREAFNREFVNVAGTLKNETQTGYLLAIAFDLLPTDKVTKAGEALRNKLKNNNYHLDTGFLGVNLLLPVLSQLGYDDIAVKLLLNETYPSWGYSIKNGATTIWERWDGWTQEHGFQTPKMNSFNHYAYGSCGEWLFAYLAGIRPDPEHPGGRNWLFEPPRNFPFDWLEAEHLTLYGKIKITLYKKNGKIGYELSAPPGINIKSKIK